MGDADRNTARPNAGGTVVRLETHRFEAERRRARCVLSDLLADAHLAISDAQAGDLLGTYEAHRLLGWATRLVLDYRLDLDVA